MTPPVLPPTPASPAIQAALDAEHLRLLELGFYVSGIMTALRFLWLLFIGAFFVVVGLVAVVASPHGGNGGSNGPPPLLFFLVFATIFGLVIVFSLIFAALEIYAGRCLKMRRHPTVIQVIAAFYCISIPWGTALGVCTFIVLNRPGVKALFAPV